MHWNPGFDSTGRSRIASEELVITQKTMEAYPASLQSTG
jgi:hypothetical protein